MPKNRRKSFWLSITFLLAVGLLVAIPCVVLNNVLRRRVAELLTLHRVQHGA